MSRFLCILWLAVGAIFAAEPDPAKLHAWYRSDGVQIRGATVTTWNNHATTGVARSLTRKVGQPRAVLVSTPCGTKTMVHFDGKSALWQPVSAWGTLSSERAVVAMVRLTGAKDGFLFDGSTNSGKTRAQVIGGKWSLGVEGAPAANADPKTIPSHEANSATWQVHTFAIKRTAQGAECLHSVAGQEAKSIEVEDHPLAGFVLGANVATGRGLVCDVAEVLVYDRSLATAEIKDITEYLEAKWGQPKELSADKQPKALTIADDPRVFRKVLRKQGEDGVKSYRIPGLATTPKGTLIAVFDLRNKGAGDLPADIDVGAMRSMDHGETWTPVQRIMDFDSTEPGSQGNGVGDPAVLVDAKTGAIFVAALWSKGMRAWAGSGPGFSPAETGQFVIAKSIDDGVSWSKPVSITPQVKDPAWRICFNGPGNGIQLRDGTLVFAAQFKGADDVPHACFIASVDGGEKWKISPAAIPGQPATSEAQIAELADGSLLLSMRNEKRTGQRVWARWEWKGDLFAGKWSEPWHAVTDPTCMASLIRHPRGELLSSNPDSVRERIDMTIRSSSDGGKTWSDGKLLDPRPSAYSCMTVLNDGRVGILYEVGESNPYETLAFARFPLEWAMEPKAPSTPVANPAVVPVSRNPPWWMPRHEEKLSITKKGGIDLAFLGDSITQGWESHGKDAWAKYYAPRNAANYGFSGDHTQHVLWRLCNGEFDGISPKVVVLMIGTNNTGGDSSTPAQTVEGVRAILDKLAVKCPQSKILLLAVFPRGATPSDAKRRANEQINAKLPSLADGTRVHFLSINDKFLQSDGALSREIMPDLLHPRAKGYAIWAEAIEPKLKELLGEQ
jgi:sialidase-1